MANVSHANLTGANLHEPKGVASATSGQVYVADGATSGTWTKIKTTHMYNLSANGTSGQTYIVDGSGGHSLQHILAHGEIYFLNLATPTTVVYPSSYTKVAPTTTAVGVPTEFTEATTARLTYTGTPTRDVRVHAVLSLSQSAGANRDLQLAIYKNGSIVTGAEMVETSVTGEKRQFTVGCMTSCATNDYFEVYVKNTGASGDIDIYSYRLMAQAVI